MHQNYHIALIQNAIDYVESHLDSEMKVTDVCAQAPMSPWQFQRIFRLYIGISIGEYISGRRLSAAAEKLILSPNTRVLDIAVEFGFGSQEAFTRAFKKRFGITPGSATSRVNEIRLLRKARLSEEQLNHNLRGIQRQPLIRVEKQRKFVGLQIRIRSPFANDFGHIHEVSDLWAKFNPFRKEIPDRLKGVGYGLVLSESGTMTEDELDYAATVEVAVTSGSARDFQSRFVEISIDEQLYAVFEKHGLAEKSKMSLDYIYGYWLPYSDYKRVGGYDFEIFDHRTRLDNPDSISSYCIPVARK